MSYACYLAGVEMPTPAKLTVKIKNQNKTLILLNEGEINFLRAPGLTELVVPFTFPMLAGKAPDHYLGLLERLKTAREPTQFILVRRSPDGRTLYDTNLKVSVEDYSMVEDAAKGLDVGVDVSLKQWRSYGTKRISLEPNGGEAASGGGKGAALTVGSLVTFTGGRHYVSSTEDAGYPASAGPAKITAVNKAGKHPYHLIHTTAASNVYGWVDEGTIQTGGSGSFAVEKERDTSTAPAASTYTVKAGDSLWAIAARYYGKGAEYTRILDANTDKISSPISIQPGQVLVIP